MAGRYPFDEKSRLFFALGEICRGSSVDAENAINFRDRNNINQLKQTTFSPALSNAVSTSPTSRIDLHSPLNYPCFPTSHGAFSSPTCPPTSHREAISFNADRCPTSISGSLPRIRPSDECSICGYMHCNTNSDKNSRDYGKGNCGRGNTDKGGKGDGDRKGNRGSRGDDGRKGSDRGNTGDDGRGGSDRGFRGNRGDDGRGGRDRGFRGDRGDDECMIVIGNDPKVCPKGVANFLFFTITFLVILCYVGVFMCAETDSLQECSSQIFGGTSCAMNNKILNFLSEKGIGCKGKGSKVIPTHLQGSYKVFTYASKNKNCRNRLGGGSSCEGLFNYAGTMAGAQIIDTGDTIPYHNPMLCRCQDKNMHNRVCIPAEKKCKCICDKIPVETIIEEKEALVPGKCWAFSGFGEVKIGLSFPIVVLGATIHHPAKGQLAPGFFNSAPKNFTIWGLVAEEDTSPHFFGDFQYVENGGSTQIFEVKNHSPVEFPYVKFNFTSNHGNPNYTAVYKVEVHGILDRK